MKKNFWTISLGDIISILVVVLVTTLCGCDDTDKKEKLPPPLVELSETLEPEAIVEPTIDPIPVVPETNEIPNGAKPWTTYWYVAYDVHIAKTDARYQGFTIVTFETQYFDVEQAIKQIEPNFVKEDYVGFTFFEQVPVETYKAYEKSNL